jgi:hypothetical protein
MCMTRIVVRLGALLPALAIALVAAPALAQDRGIATLRVCNKGTASINVVAAYDVEVGLFGRALDVNGWFFLAPGQCRVVVETQGFDGCDGQSTLPVYLGFARFDAPYAGAAARVDAVPDFGTWQHNLGQILVTAVGAGPVLSRADKTLCVRRGALGYRVTDRSESCASLGANRLLTK